MQDFPGKVAVVTGAASGIGLELVRQFHRAGMRLVMADIEEAPLQRAAAEFEGALPVVTDVRKAEDVERLAEAAFDHFGAVHVLCNNAGVIGEGAPAWEESLQNWKWILDVNLWGVVHGIHAFVPRMLRSGEPGHIVNTASLAGLTTRPFMNAYNVSKHSVVALSECLFAELELMHAPIQVSVVCPAFAKTRLAEAMRNRDPEIPAADAHGFHSALKTVVERGTPPEEIARQAFEAVQEGRFWVLTNPEFDSAIRERFEGMLARRNPPVRDLRQSARAK